MSCWVWHNVTFENGAVSSAITGHLSSKTTVEKKQKQAHHKTV